jgi:hypothetical protein
MAQERKLTDEEVRALYAQAKRDFSVDDLRRFFTEEEGIPLGSFIEEIEEELRTQKGEGSSA